MLFCFLFFFFFFFNDTATTEIYTLSLHDALPILAPRSMPRSRSTIRVADVCSAPPRALRSEEHTSELQSQFHLVCRLLLEKKKKGVSTMTDRGLQLYMIGVVAEMLQLHLQTFFFF